MAGADAGPWDEGGAAKFSRAGLAGGKRARRRLAEEDGDSADRGAGDGTGRPPAARSPYPRGAPLVPGTPENTGFSQFEPARPRGGLTRPSMKRRARHGAAQAHPRGAAVLRRSRLPAVESLFSAAPCSVWRGASESGRPVVRGAVRRRRIQKHGGADSLPSSTFVPLRIVMVCRSGPRRSTGFETGGRRLQVRGSFRVHAALPPGSAGLDRKRSIRGWRATTAQVTFRPVSRAPPPPWVADAPPPSRGRDRSS